MMRIWWILPCMLLGLQACGFHLRGVASLPQHMSEIQLLSSGLSSDQQYRLRQRLQDAGARIHSTEDVSRVRLSISIKTLPESALVDSAGSGQQLVRLSRELTYSVVAADGNRLVDNKTLVSSEDIELDENNLLANEGEKQSAINNVDDNLFNQLLNQLQRL